MNQQIETNQILRDYGWTQTMALDFEKNNEKGYIIGRVITQHSNISVLITEKGPIHGEVSGKYKFKHTQDHTYPVIGDFVIFEWIDNGTRGIIHDLVPRRTQFSRKIAGNETLEQVVATNFDTVFIFNALNKDFNVRKIERYLSIAWDSGATPVIVLSKADLALDYDNQVALVEAAAMGVDVIPISALTGDHIDRLAPYLIPGQTIALLGASGVGKSTLINTLAGKALLKTNEVRLSDDRGKHTTTHKEIVMLANGTMLMDTPGMRELGMWTNTEGIGESFSDIEVLATECKFHDCKHQNEPGCAVQEAIQKGTLPEKRYKNYLHLLREAAFVEAKNNQRLRSEQNKKYKEISKAQKKLRPHQ